MGSNENVAMSHSTQIPMIKNFDSEKGVRETSLSRATEASW